MGSRGRTRRKVEGARPSAGLSFSPEPLWALLEPDPDGVGPLRSPGLTEGQVPLTPKSSKGSSYRVLPTVSTHNRAQPSLKSHVTFLLTEIQINVFL